MEQQKWLRYGILTLAVAIGIIIFGTQKEQQAPASPRDYDEIRQSGVLRAVTEYNAVSYHVTGDTLQGFDYELLNAFAADKGLSLQITPEMSFGKRLQGINEGRYDLLATGTVVTSRLKDSLLFTRTLLLSKQVLVQRKREGDKDSTYIGNQLGLAHKKLYVVKNSPALLRLHNLISEIADTIYIEEVSQYGPEQLLAMVSGKDIDYAVCDENIARTSLADFPNLDIGTDIGFTQFYAWGMNKNSAMLRDTLDTWLDEYMKTKAYNRLYKKYFN